MRQRALVLRALVIVFAIVTALVPTRDELVERWYSNGVYPAMQRALTAASNLTPVAWMDVLLLAALVWLVRLWWTAWRAPAELRRRVLLEAGFRTLVGAACLYLAFLGLWGLNYRRVPLSRRLVLDKPSPSTDAVVGLGLETVWRLNALSVAAHAGGWPDPAWWNPSLRTASAGVQQLLGREKPAVTARLKQSALGLVFRWNGVDGMTNPFGLEVLANPDLLPFERPFVAAHEWAHLAGYADESEANFVGWLTCLRADTPAQYSGWLYLYWQIIGELGPRDRARVAPMLGPGPLRDLDAIAERLRRGDLPLLRRASWAAYDQYLKANRVESGVRSYGQVVTLILQTRFDDNWRPIGVRPR